MKKNWLLIILSFVFFSLNAQEWSYLTSYSQYYQFAEKNYKTSITADVYDSNGNILDTVKANKVFKSSKFAYVQDMTNDIFDTFEYMIGYEENRWISTDTLVIENSDVLPDSIVTTNKKRHEKKWIPVWYNNILTLGHKLEEYSDYYSDYKGSQEYVFASLHEICFKNIILIFTNTNDDTYFSIKEIKQKANTFYVTCEIEKSEQSYFNSYFDNESFANLPNFTVNRETTFIIEQNGNRLRVYNGENYKLIIELMPVNKAWADMMIKYCDSDYKNKPSNLKPIAEKLDHPWSDPKTGLYEGNSGNKSNKTVASTTITPDQTMTVTENLKLRSGEATSTKVLSVMAAGTKVKILEVGKSETIDGIKSNWVKVEVQKNARDRDGKAIKAGTVGWCYGGYLK